MKKYTITVNGTAYDVQVQEAGAAASAPAAAPATAPAAPAASPAPAPTPASAPAGATRVEAPMPGNILEVRAQVGQQVSAGDPLVILEAMKMENDIVAPTDGVVAAIHVVKGDTVDTGTLLVSLS